MAALSSAYDLLDCANAQIHGSGNNAAIFSPSRTLSYFSNIIITNCDGGAATAKCNNGMFRVVLSGAPLQIFYAVIKRNSVNVINMIKFIWIWNKGLGDKPMQVDRLANTISVGNVGSAVPPQGRWAHCPKLSSHVALVGNFVIGVLSYRTPFHIKSIHNVAVA